MRDEWFRTPQGDFHYLDWEGQGPLAHMAHATGFCARTYTPLAERLNHAIHVVGLDDRGHGLSRAAADPARLTSWKLFSKDLEAFFAQQGQSLVAMGHSRGAVASLMLAVRRPDLVRALILIDPTILPFSWMWWWYLAKKTGLAKHVPIAARAARRKAIWPDRETVIKAYKGKGAFKDWTPGFLEGYLADGLRENGNGSVRLSCSPAWEARCFAVCDHDVWSYVPRPTQPVLVLYGQRSDTFLPAAVRRFQKAAPLAEVVAVEGAGHFVPMEKPEETVRLILDFLRRHRIIDAEGA